VAHLLADLNFDGEERKVLMHAPRNGNFYVLDRITGKFISGIGNSATYAPMPPDQFKAGKVDDFAWIGEAAAEIVCFAAESRPRWPASRLALLRLRETNELCPRRDLARLPVVFRLRPG
jgi:hypothetical protein